MMVIVIRLIQEGVVVSVLELGLLASEGTCWASCGSSEVPLETGTSLPFPLSL